VNELEEFVLDAHGESLSLMREVYLLNGREIIVVDGEVNHGSEPDVAGFSADKAVTITVAKDEFYSATGGLFDAIGKIVVCAKTNQRFRINEIVENTRTLIDLNLIAETQGQ
jgi:hypothetical protein